MAAAEVLVSTESWTGSEYGWRTTRPSRTGWDERSLRVQLGLIAHIWVADRCDRQVRNVFSIRIFLNFWLVSLPVPLRCPWCAWECSMPTRSKLYTHPTTQWNGRPLDRRAY